MAAEPPVDSTNPREAPDAPARPPSLPTAPLWGSALAFAACAAIGLVPGGATLLALRRFGLAADLIAFGALAVFAAFHVAAIIVLVPRLQARGKATLRHTSLIAVLVWVIAIGAVMIGARIAARWRLAADDAAMAEVGRKIDAALGTGGFRRIILDRYVALTDVVAVGTHVRAVGGTQELSVLASDDAGATWRVLPLDKRWNSPRALYFADQSRGWLMAVGDKVPALLRTEDGGATWSPVVSPSVGGAMACKTRDRCWHVGTDPAGKFAVHVTNDGGATWTSELSLDAPAAPARFTEPVCAMLPGTGERVLCLGARSHEGQSLGGFALVRTDLAGAGAWSETPLGADVHRWKDLWTAPASTGALLIRAAASTVRARPGEPEPAAGGLLASSDDGGATFATAPLGLPPGLAPADVDILSPERLYAISDDRLWRSEDGGRTFGRETAFDEYGAHGNLFLRKMEFVTLEQGVIIKANGALVVRAGLGTAPLAAATAATTAP